MATRDTMVSLPAGPARVRVHGDDGPALLWTHGVFHPVDVDERSPLGPVLSGIEGWRVVRYDTRGQGRTPAAERDELHAWEVLGDELLALADALGIERFVAGGISMGAAVTLHAATRAPERIEAMVLLAPPTAWETRPAAVESYERLAALVAEGGAEAVATQVLMDLERDMPDGVVPAALLFMVDELAKADAVGLGRVLRAAARSDLPAREALAQLEIPTLLLPWVDDPGHPLQTASALEACLAATRTVVLQGVTDTERLVGALAGFLQDVRAASEGR